MELKLLVTLSMIYINIRYAHINKMKKNAIDRINIIFLDIITEIK